MSPHERVTVSYRCAGMGQDDGYEVQTTTTYGLSAKGRIVIVGNEPDCRV